MTIAAQLILLVVYFYKKIHIQTNNNDLLEKDGGTKNYMYKD